MSYSKLYYIYKNFKIINMNNLSLLGRLGGDPELKTSKNDKAFATFSIATNDGYGDNKKTNWHRCIAFGKTAEIIDQYVKKGQLLAVQGSVEYSKSDDDKVYTNIVVNSFTFANDNSQGSSSTDSSDDAEDDLPFD